MISCCFTSYIDLIGGFSAVLTFIFSAMVSSLVSGTRLLLIYFSVSVERAIEED